MDDYLGDFNATETESNRRDLEKYEYKLAEKYTPADDLNEDLLKAYEKEPECDEWNHFFVAWMIFVFKHDCRIENTKIEEWIKEQPWQVRQWLWKRGFITREEKEKRATHYSCNITLTWVEEKEMWRATAREKPETESFAELCKTNKIIVCGFGESKDKEEAVQLAVSALYG